MADIGSKLVVSGLGSFSHGLDGCFVAVLHPLGGPDPARQALGVAAGWITVWQMRRIALVPASICPLPMVAGMAIDSLWRLVVPAAVEYGCDDQLDPPISDSRVAHMRPEPAQGLFQKPEGLFQIEAADEHRPPMITLSSIVKDGFGSP